MHGKLRIPILFIAIVIYLLYHIMNGNRSIFVYLEKRNTIAKKLEKLNNMKEINLKLENKINRLQDNNIDPDLLDEQARLILGKSEKDDIVLVEEA